MAAEAKGALRLKYLPFLLACTCVAASQSSAVNCGGFVYQPYDQYIPEGAVNATFRCFYNGTVLSVAWLINGRPISEVFDSATPPTSIYPSTERIGGATVNVLTIGALPEHNGTLVTCEANFLTPDLTVCNASAVLLIMVPPGPVCNLELHSSPTELMLTWEHSPVTTDFTVQYCIDVYRTVGEEKRRVHSECIVNQTSYVFGTSKAEPDPNNLYQFIVTPRYNIEGAKEGTPTNTSGYFAAGPPMLYRESMSVSITIDRDLLVTLHITLDNAESWVTGGTRADEFLVKVVLDSGQSYNCSPIQRPPMISNSTLFLHTNCSGLPVQRLGNVTVTAVNSIGSSNLTGPINTNPIQDVRITQPCSSSQCQFEVTYNVVADSKLVTASFVVLNDGDDVIRYIVNSHSVNGIQYSVPVSGLTGGFYNVVVFSLNASGLPFTNPEGKITNVSVNADTDGDHQEKEVHIKELKHIGGGCFQCWFASSSSASHCAVIVHTLDKVVNVSLFIRRGDFAHGCVSVEAGWYFVVAYGFTNNAIHGSPYVAGRIRIQATKSSVVPIEAILVIILVVAVAAIVAIVATVTVKAHRCHQKKTVQHRKVERDQTVTFDNLMELFRDKRIMSRWHDLGKQLQFPSQKLRNISSMEDLLKCYTTDHHFSLDWSYVRDALNRMGERQLASEVYTSHMLRKQIQNQNQSDSGRYTLTCSSTVDNGEDNHIHSENNERVEFAKAQSVCDGDGPALLTTPLQGAYAIEDSERQVHKQATSDADGSKYDEMIRETLSSRPDSGHHITVNDNAAFAVNTGEMESVFYSFHNYKSTD